MTGLDIPFLTTPVSPVPQLQQWFMDVSVEDVFPEGQFSIALPRLWQTNMAGADQTVDDATPALMLLDARPGAEDAYGAQFNARVQVICAKLFEEVNGADWLRMYLDGQEMHLVEIVERPTAYGVMGDVVAIDTNGPRLHRMMTIKDGDRIFLIHASVDHLNQPEWPNFQEIGLMAIMRFKLHNPTGERYAVPVEEASLGGGGATAHFLLPVHWSGVDAGDAPPSGSALQFVYVTETAITGTLVAILGGPGDSIEGLNSVFAAKLDAQGFALDAPVPQMEATQDDLHLLTLVQPAEKQGRDMAIMHLHATRGEQALHLAMIGPSADADFEAWAVNRRAFEIALETLRIELH